MALKIIAAVAANGVIGSNGHLPWNLPADLAHFKKVTGSAPVVMGKKTFTEIIKRLHKPLPGRQNIVLTRNQLLCSDVIVLGDFKKVIERAETEDIFVIGGAKLYELSLPIASEMYLTRVLAAPGGDTRFPEWNEKEWTRVSSEKYLKNERNEHDFIFEHYLRRSARFIEMSNIRTPKQTEDMSEILALGVCPFCEDFIKKAGRWHRQKFLWEGVHWVVTYNNYPYPWTKPVLADAPDSDKMHLLLVLKTHAETAAEIPSGAFEEIGTILRWAENEYNIEGGGLFLRFGEPLWSGGTVRHLHAHIAQRKNLETSAVFYLS